MILNTLPQAEAYRSYALSLLYMYLIGEGPSKRVRQRGFVKVGPTKKVRRRRSDEEGPMKKVQRRRSNGEDLTEKIR